MRLRQLNGNPLAGTQLVCFQQLAFNLLQVPNPSDTVEQLMTQPSPQPPTRPDQEVFRLEGRIAHSTIEQRVIQPLPTTLQHYAARLDPEWQRALTTFQQLELRDTFVYVAGSFAYRQLPLGTTFEMVFPIKRPQAAVQSQSRLVAVIAEWVALPMPFVDAGHRSICLFEFPHSIPRIIEELPVVERFGQGSLDEHVGLSSLATWRVMMQKYRQRTA
jgi:hypothetical protein